jgi:hypothetical protein
MWSGRNRSGETSRVGSLLVRLEALEQSADFSNFSTPTATIVRAAPNTVTVRRSPRLHRWFWLGFGCSCLGGGGIALLTSLVINPAQAKPSFGACTRTEPVVQSGIMPEARQLWWKLPASIDRTQRSALARAHE